MLGIIAIVLILILMLLTQKEKNHNRFSFQTNFQTREVYVFDRQTGTLFLTSPAVVGDYADEVWVQLNPTKKNTTLSFKQLLDDTARRKLRKEFLDRKKQIKEQESKKQLNSKEPNDGI